MKRQRSSSPAAADTSATQSAKMRVTDLPPEAVAAVFRQLDPASLARCEAVCKQWRDIAQWDSVLRSVCISQGYLDARTTLEDLRKPFFSTPHTRRIEEIEETPENNAHGRHWSHARLQGRPEKDLASYRAFLYSSARLRYTWPTFESPCGSTADPADSEPLSSEHAVLKHLGPTTDNVHRVKIDHVEGVAFLTFWEAEDLRVMCLQSGQQLFSVELGQAYAHIEADQGWVVNSQMDWIFTIWRLESLGSAEKTVRGKLERMRTIRCPSEPRALRLRFPHLATATSDGKIFVYDVTNGEEVQCFDLQSPWPRADLQILYIELDEEFIFVLFYSDEWPLGAEKEGGWLQVYSREDSACCFSGHDSDLDQDAYWYQCAQTKPEALKTGATDWRYAHAWQWEPHMWQGHRAIPLGTGEHAKLEHSRRRAPALSAVHFDERTESLCLYAELRHMLVIPEYKSVFRSRGTVKAQPIGIAAPDPQVWEEEGDDGDSEHTFAIGNSFAAFIMDRRYLTLVNLEDLLKAHPMRTAATPHPPRPPVSAYGQQLGDFYTWTYGAPAELSEHAGLHFDQCTSLQLDATSLTLVGRVEPEGIWSTRAGSKTNAFMFDFAEWSRMPWLLYEPDMGLDRQMLSRKVLDVSKGTLLDLCPYEAKHYYREEWGDPGPDPDADDLLDSELEDDYQSQDEGPFSELHPAGPELIDAPQPPPINNQDGASPADSGHDSGYAYHPFGTAEDDRNEEYWEEA